MGLFLGSLSCSIDLCIFFVSINRYMDKEDGVYIYSGILSHKREGYFAICRNMDGLGEHYAK